MDLSIHLPAESLQVAFLEPGQLTDAADGWTHRKLAPATIIAQAVEGRYEVAAPDRHVVAAGGECFLAAEGVPLAITHHASTRGGRMRARWLHARFVLFHTVDVVGLLDLPPKTDAALGARFGALIAELLSASTPASATAATSASAVNPLVALARRQELGFQALRLLCEVAPLSQSGRALLSHAERLAPVFAHIRANLHKPIEIDALAARAGLSRSRFHTYFREHMRQSPMAYVKAVRLNEARQLLFTTAHPLTEIAARTGFCTPFHLSREFKRQFGQPPHQYRTQADALRV